MYRFFLTLPVLLTTQLGPAQAQPLSRSVYDQLRIFCYLNSRPAQTTRNGSLPCGNKLPEDALAGQLLTRMTGLCKVLCRHLYACLSNTQTTQTAGTRQARRAYTSLCNTRPCRPEALRALLQLHCHHSSHTPKRNAARLMGWGQAAIASSR